MNKKPGFSVLVALGLLLSLQAKAVPITFTSEATYLAAAGPQNLESFETATATNTFVFGASVTLADMTVALSNGGPLGSAGGGVRNSSFSGAHATDGANFFINSTAGGGLKGLTIIFNNAITEFGVNITGLPQFTADLLYQTDAGHNGTAGFGAGADDQFFGLIDTMSAFSVISFTTTASSIHYGIDEIYYSGAGSVPEPATLLLLGLGLAGLGFARRRLH